MGRVWVIGSLNVDRAWQVSRHPSVGETVAGQMLDPLPGGKGLNQAVAARRVGADVSLVGCVGADADGDWLVGIAADEGIDVSHVARSPALPTGSALIVIDGVGANTVTVSSGANTDTRVADLPIAAGDVVVLQLEIPVAAVEAALDLAAARGATSIFNPSPVGPGSSLAPSADVLVVNQHEAAGLLGPAAGPAASADEALVHARAIRRLDHLAIVTLGADGVVGVGDDGDHRIAGIAVDAVDTTGAGDCFLGVLASGLADGLPVGQSIERANAAAARSVQRLGTVASMPTAAELGWP